MNQQHPQVWIASLDDSEVPLFVAAGMLPGHQSDPCRPLWKDRPSAMGRYDGGSSDWPNAFHCSDLLAKRIASVHLLNLLLHFGDALFQGAEFFAESGQKLSPKSTR